MAPELRQFVLSFVPGPYQVATAAGGRTLRVCRDGLQRQSVHVMEAAVVDVKLFPSGDQLLVADSDFNVVVLSTRSDRELQPAMVVLQRVGLGLPIFESQVFPDGERAVVVGENGTIRIFSATTGAWVDTLACWGTCRRPEQARVHPSGRHVVTGVSNITLDPVIVWDVTAHARMMHILLPREGDRIGSMELSPDGAWLVTGGHSGIDLWETLTGQVHLQALGGPGPMPWSAQVSDGANVVAGLQSGSVFLWPSEGGRRATTLPVQADILAFMLQPAGDAIVTYEDTGRATIWDVATGRSMRALLGGPGALPGYGHVHASGAAGAVGVCRIGSKVVQRSAAVYDQIDSVLSMAWELRSGRGFCGSQEQLGLDDVAFSPDGVRPCRVAVGRVGSVLDWLTLQAGP